MKVIKTTIVDKLPKCGFCEEPAEYDGKTKLGHWGCMCQHHFDQYGIGLGLGQKLVLEPPDTAAQIDKADELCKRCGKGCDETSWNKQVGRYRILDDEAKIAAIISLELYCEEM